MVGRPGQYQLSCNAGELAPSVWGNTGLKQYYAGLAREENVESVPQGGFTVAPRTRYRAELPLIVDPDTGRPAVKEFPFTVDRAHAYMVVMTPLVATIFLNGVEVFSLATPYPASVIKQLKFVQRDDTMMIFHVAYAPRRLLRLGDDTHWSFDIPGFSNVPIVQYDGVYTNVTEQWTLYIQWPDAPFDPTGMEFVVSADGEETSAINITSPTFIADLANALQALAGVEPGIDIAGAGSSANSASWFVAFGGFNSGFNFTFSGRIVTTTLASLQTWRNVKGVLGGEALFSDARGFPACGRFYQDRLTLGGFASKPTAFGASRTGEYFDLNILLPTDSGGLLYNISTDGGENIIDMVQSKHLVIFTSEADYFVNDDGLSATTPPKIIRSSTYGCSSNVPICLQESGLIYVNRDETQLYAATYDAVSAAYVSDPLSLLAPHLVQIPADAALQKASSATSSQRYWFVRTDGMVVLGLLIRNQDVTAFVRWTTDGMVRAVGVDGANRGYMAVQRQVGGVAKLFLESIEEGLLLDCAVTVTNGAPSDVVGGLTMHEGATVWAISDGGYVEGPFTVVGGAITLQFPATTVTVGRWNPPVVTTLPLVRDVAAHQVLKRPARVHTVVLDLINTTSVAVGANGRPARDRPLARGGDKVDTPPVSVTRQETITGLQGFTPEGQVTITQVRPGALTVRDITLEARI